MKIVKKLFEKLGFKQKTKPVDDHKPTQPGSTGIFFAQNPEQQPWPARRPAAAPRPTGTAIPASRPTGAPTPRQSFAARNDAPPPSTPTYPNRTNDDDGLVEGLIDLTRVASRALTNLSASSAAPSKNNTEGESSSDTAPAKSGRSDNFFGAPDGDGDRSSSNLPATASPPSSSNSGNSSSGSSASSSSSSSSSDGNSGGGDGGGGGGGGSSSDLHYADITMLAARHAAARIDRHIRFDR